MVVEVVTVDPTTLAFPAAVQAALNASMRTDLTGSAAGSTAMGKALAVAVDAKAARDAVNVNGLRSPILGQKIRGANITVKPSGLGWPGLFAEWDWTNWIQPQIDRAAGLGLNAIRLIGSPECVYKDPSGTLLKITQATYVARWSQVAEYCLSKGLYLYPCLVAKWDFIDVQVAGGTPFPAGPFNFQESTVTAVTVASAQTLGAFPNVVGFDLFQEGDTVYGLTVADVLAMYTAVRGVAPHVPVTTSNTSGNFGSAAGFWGDTTSTQAQLYLATGGCDFVDLHIYLDSVLPSDIDGFQQRTGKPILIGEFGDSQDQTTGNIAARYTAVAALHNRRGVMGALAWALADQSATNTNQWGVWDNTGFSQPSFPSSSGSTPLSLTTGKRTYMTQVLPKFNRADKLEIYKPPNMLSVTQQRPRNSITQGWASGANTYQYVEPRGLGFSATAAGTTLVATTPVTAVPVIAATYYKAIVNVLAGSTARTISLNVDWYDSGSAYLLSSAANTGTDSATIPLTLALVVRSHASAAYGVLVVKNTASIVTNEAHIIMDAVLELM